MGDFSSHPLPGPEAPHLGPSCPSIVSPSLPREAMCDSPCSPQPGSFPGSISSWAGQPKMKPERRAKQLSPGLSPVVTSMTRSGHDPCPAAFAPKQQLSVKHQDC